MKRVLIFILIMIWSFCLVFTIVTRSENIFLNGILGITIIILLIGFIYAGWKLTEGV